MDKNKKVRGINEAAMRGILNDALCPEKKITVETLYFIRDSFAELLPTYCYPTPGEKVGGDDA